jgi:class 3 adenylate cyclase
MQGTTHSFVFADLSGYTALTERIGDDAAADLAIAFRDAVHQRARSNGGRVIKTLGDGVLIHTRSARGAVAIALRVIEELSGVNGFPDVHVGVDTGPAVRRDGDWYGSTVNRAARIVDRAGAGEVLVSEATYEALGSSADLQLDGRGVHPLRNIADPPQLFAVSRAHAGEAAARPPLTILVSDSASVAA